MKQIIDHNPNGSIWCKYYLNNNKKQCGVTIGYWTNNKLWFKQNWKNGEKYGLDVEWRKNG